MDPPVKLQLLKGGTGIIPSCLVVLVQLLKSAFKGMAKIVLLPQLSYKQPWRITCTFIAVEIMYCLHIFFANITNCLQYSFCIHYEQLSVYFLMILRMVWILFYVDMKICLCDLSFLEEELFVLYILITVRGACTIYSANIMNCLHCIFCWHL